MNPTGLPLRIVYTVVAFPVGAIIGFFLAIRLLLHVGTIFHDAHPSMQGFAYFMMALSAGCALGLTFSLTALTLPWKRPARSSGRIGRMIASAAIILLVTLNLLGQGSAPVFALAIAVWLSIAMYLTYVRHGALDDKAQVRGQD